MGKSILEIVLGDQLPDAAYLYDIAHLCFHTSQEFKASLQVSKHGLDTLQRIAYTISIIETLKQHPEFYSVFLDEVVTLKDKNPFSLGSTEEQAICALPSLLKYRIISNDDALFLLDYFLCQRNVLIGSILAFYIYKTISLLPKDKQPKKDFYRFLRREMPKLLIFEIADMIVNDYKYLQEQEKYYIRDMILNLPGVEIEEHFAIHKDFWLDFTYDAILSALIDHKHEERMTQLAYLLIDLDDRAPELFARIAGIDKSLFSSASHPLTRALGFIAGSIDRVEITEKDLDMMPGLIFCLNREQFWRFFTSCAGDSIHSSVFLNNDAICDDRAQLVRLLKLYLRLDYEDRKLREHLLLIDDITVQSLLPEEIINLIRLSFIFGLEPASPIPVRFRYTDKAIDLIKTRVAPYILSGELSTQDFSNFLKVHQHSQ